MKADGHEKAYKTMQKVAGVFGLTASLLGYYTTAHYMCEDALRFSLPMGQLSRDG